LLSEDRKECFVEAVESRKHAMYRLALMMLKSEADAEDAVSEAVEATWRNLSRIRDIKALPAYLMRSTINACHAALRKRKRETTVADFEAQLPPAQPEAAVWMYLGGLKEKYRLPILLRYSENMSDQEIASLLRIPRGTVASRLSRGLNILRLEMEKEEKGRG
jgi:RNA polymerase sigma-70 factor (ECF subfamily)